MPNPRKILIALTPSMLEEVDKIAQAEHRTRSDLMREMARRYIFAFKEHTSLDSIVLKKVMYFSPNQKKERSVHGHGLSKSGVGEAAVPFEVSAEWQQAREAYEQRVAQGTAF